MNKKEELNGLERPNTQYGKIMKQVGCHLIKDGVHKLKEE